MKLSENFWSKVDIRVADCWNWLGAIDRYGYGRYRRVEASTVLPHRLSYMEIIGPIPEGHQLDHLCLNKRCVNPDHLEPVTNSENMRRRYMNYTHCINGHEFSEENTYITPRGHRSCRSCNSVNVQIYKSKKRAAR